MEQQVTMEAIAGDPFEFLFEENLVIRSGFGVKLNPTLVDSFGQEMNDTLAGMKAWTAENGSITSEGYFFASAPGFWNISVRAGSVFGNGTIRVIPADAAIVSIQIVPEQTTYQSGEVYRLDAVRTDSSGYTSPVPVPIVNWSVGNGAVAQVGDEVHWTPGKVGSFTMEVVDSDIAALGGAAAQFREYTFSTENIPSFKYYRVKFVLSGTDQTYVPKVSDLRVITLA